MVIFVVSSARNVYLTLDSCLSGSFAYMQAPVETFTARHSDFQFVSEERCWDATQLAARSHLETIYRCLPVLSCRLLCHADDRRAVSR